MTACRLEAKARLLLMIEQHQAEIIVPFDLPTASGYAPWIEEVWVNYLSNGIKYGGQPARLECGANKLANGTIKYWVRDNGPGLTPEQQSKLFTPFTRLNSVNIEGHGLGLSIVQRIIEKLGGTVGVESQLGQGSLFFFTLSSQSETKEQPTP
ncbi:MAG: ATP-binding protein [Chloroflexi bacterium]|nr:MAG: ATP-binding protein [Chloroflexota bacterium]